MTLDKLKKMLEDGAINQAEFDEMVDKLGLKAEEDEDDKGEEKKDDKTKSLEALIQSAVDRATNKLGNENKTLRKQLEDLRKEKLSDDEIKRLELEEKEKALEAKDKEIKAKELRMFASNAIRDAGLDDGSDTARSLVDILIGEDEDSITAKVQSFKTLLNKSVESQVTQRFKDSGRDMKKGGSTDTSDSDESKEDNVAVKLAQNTAANNKATQSIIDHYSGGKTV